MEIVLLISHSICWFTLSCINGSFKRLTECLDGLKMHATRIGFAGQHRRSFRFWLYACIYIFYTCIYNYVYMFENGLDYQVTDSFRPLAFRQASILNGMFEKWIVSWLYPILGRWVSIFTNAYARTCSKDIKLKLEINLIPSYTTALPKIIANLTCLWVVM